MQSQEVLGDRIENGLGLRIRRRRCERPRGEHGKGGRGGKAGKRFAPAKR
jgi:hypothetical protein